MYESSDEALTRLFYEAGKTMLIVVWLTSATASLHGGVVRARLPPMGWR